jgi:flagellar biosynthesis anti-sigma factor FlgM
VLNDRYKLEDSFNREAIMVNKIDSYNANNLRRIDTAKVSSPNIALEKSSTAEAKTGVSGSSGSLLSRGLSLAKQAPEVDQGRVDSLKQAISRGEFQVDARAIASALMAMDAD